MDEVHLYDIEISPGSCIGAYARRGAREIL